MNEHSDSVAQTAAVTHTFTGGHTATFNSYLGTVRCTCGLWAAYRTTPVKCSEEFQEHVQKETIHPTNEATRRKANLKPSTMFRRRSC